MNFVPVPLIVIMGGVRLTPAESFVAAHGDVRLLLGIVTLPVWGIGTLRGLGPRSRNQPEWPAFDDPQKPEKVPDHFAVASVAIWFK